MIGSGSALIAGGTLVDIDYQRHIRQRQLPPTYGELVLRAAKFSGEIFGFAGTAPDSTHSDIIELAGFKETSYSEQLSNGNPLLTLNGASGSVQLTFADIAGALSISTDALGDTLIRDPAGIAACPGGSVPSLNGVSSNPVVSAAVWPDHFRRRHQPSET